MDKGEIRERVIRTISQVMDVAAEEVSDSSSYETIGSWDSLNHMNLIFALEEQFDVQFSDTQIMEMLDVSLIVSALYDAKQ